MRRNRSLSVFPALLTTLAREAVGTGVVPLVLVAGGLVVLSPQLAIFTLGNRLAAQKEAVAGSLIGILAFTSTLIGILIVRALLEEKTLGQLMAMGASCWLIGGALCAALLLISVWQTMALVLAASGVLSSGKGLLAGGMVLALAGLMGARPLLALLSSGSASGVRRRTMRAAGALLAVLWLAAAGWLVLGVLGREGLKMLFSLLGMTAWGSVIGLVLGSRLSIPQALTGAFAIWTGWSASGPLLERVLGAGASPLLPWNALLAGSGSEAGSLWFVWLAGAAISAWLMAACVTPMILNTARGSSG